MWEIAAAAAGANLASGLLQGSVQERLAKQAMKAAAFKPYNVTTGMGSVQWGPGRTATTSLNPEYQAYKDRLFSGLQVSPEEIASNQYGMMQRLLQPGQQAATRGLESRLFSQGMLGSTGGARRMGELTAGHEQANLAAAAAALQQGQQYQQGLWGNLMQLEHAQLAPLQFGMQAGGAGAAAGANAGNFLMQGGGNPMQMAAAGLFSGAGNAIMQNPAAFQKLFTPQTPGYGYVDPRSVSFSTPMWTSPGMDSNTAAFSNMVNQGY